MQGVLDGVERSVPVREEPRRSPLLTFCRLHVPEPVKVGCPLEDSTLEPRPRRGDSTG